jgi:hypothetical protein
MPTGLAPAPMRRKLKELLPTSAAQKGIFHPKEEVISSTLPKNQDILIRFLQTICFIFLFPLWLIYTKIISLFPVLFHSLKILLYDRKNPLPGERP